MGRGGFFLLGLLVLRAQLGTASETGGKPEKLGSCPRDFTRCLQLETPLCANDSSCPGRQKCCHWDCRLRCRPPAEEQHQRKSCRSDWDCPRAERCCRHWCSPECHAGMEEGFAPGAGWREALLQPLQPPWPRCAASPQGGKPGFCPASPGLYSSYACEARCRGDGECPGEQKCCLRGCDYVCLPPARGCGPASHQGTRSPGHRVPAESQDPAAGWCVEECSTDVQCPQGQRCTSTGCSRVCVDIPGGTVGTCPIPRDRGTCLDLCSFDEECPWGQKCCSNGCGHVCMPASLAESDAAAVPRPSAGRCGEECSVDTQCPWGQRCARTGCGRVCVDITRGTVGACPVPRDRGTCLDLCSSDEECPWGQKCCSNGCGHVCCGPASHQGTRSPGHRVPAESQDPAAGWCVEECSTDVQCPQGQRCTSTGCSRVCVDIPGGTVGTCPIPRDRGTCLDLCSFDEECPWGQKCCSNGCGHVCMPASLAESDAAAVPRPSAGRCGEECSVDTQCPWGQRCARTGCGRVCVDITRGASSTGAEPDTALGEASVGREGPVALETGPGPTFAASPGLRQCCMTGERHVRARKMPMLRDAGRSPPHSRQQ
nr:PREDICTED: WAP four-disulfide core domain protein 3 [Apteryx mantelli mantelli]